MSATERFAGIAARRVAGSKGGIASICSAHPLVIEATLRHGAAQVVERTLYPASPAAGVTLAEMNPPRGMRVGAVVRGEKVFVPEGKDRLEAGDRVILFVHESELGTVQLLFPGRKDS